MNRARNWSILGSTLTSLILAAGCDDPGLIDDAAFADAPEFRSEEEDIMLEVSGGGAPLCMPSVGNPCAWTCSKNVNGVKLGITSYWHYQSIPQGDECVEAWPLCVAHAGLTPKPANKGLVVWDDCEGGGVENPFHPL